MSRVLTPRAAGASAKSYERRILRVEVTKMLQARVLAHLSRAERSSSGHPPVHCRKGRDGYHVHRNDKGGHDSADSLLALEWWMDNLANLSVDLVRLAGMLNHTYHT